MLSGCEGNPSMAEAIIAILFVALLLGPSVLASFVDLNSSVPD
jgi:hypothetical protein